MPDRKQLPSIAEAQLTPLMEQLLDQIEELLEENRRQKDQLLITALEVSRYITVDDSGARHPGNNGYVTQIGNDWFAWFAGPASKSRINFLHLLHAGNITSTLNAHARSRVFNLGGSTQFLVPRSHVAPSLTVFS